MCGVECVHHVDGDPCPVGDLVSVVAGLFPHCLQMFWAVSGGGAAVAGSAARLFGDVPAVVDELAEGGAVLLRILEVQIDLM